MTITRYMTRRIMSVGLIATVVMGTALTTSALAQDMTTIRINRSPVGTFQGLFIAEQNGYFKDRGIKIEMTIGSSPDAAIAELIAGSKDIVMTGAVPLASGVANGLNIVAVLNTQDQGETPTTGLLLPADSPINSIAGLKGKKIGLAGIASPQGVAILLELEKAGLTRDDVELVNLPFPGVLSAIEAGTVDAGMPIGLFYTLGKSKGLKEFPEVYEYLKGSPGVIFAANKDWVAKNEDVLVKFSEAMKLAYEYGNKNPDSIRKIDAEQTRLPPDFIKNRDIVPFVSAFGVKEWGRLNENLVKFGFIPRAPKTDEYIWTGAPKR